MNKLENFNIDVTTLNGFYQNTLQPLNKSLLNREKKWDFEKKCNSIQLHDRIN